MVIDAPLAHSDEPADDEGDQKKPPNRRKPEDKQWSINYFPPLVRHVPAEAGYEYRADPEGEKQLRQGGKMVNVKLHRIEGKCGYCGKICGYYCRYGPP